MLCVVAVCAASFLLQVRDALTPIWFSSLHSFLQSAQVRKDALYFVLEQLEAFDEGDEEAETTADTNTERKRAQQIESIASFAAHAMTNGNRPIDKILVHLADYLVHSLREMPEHRDLVTDWDAMLRAIKEDKAAATAHNVNAGDRANIAKQRVLVRMLTCAAKEEVGSVADESFLHRDMDTDAIIIREKKKSKKGTSSTGREHETLSIALLKALPNLLVQFKGDLAIIPELVALPRFLIPTVFSLPQKKQEYMSLIKNLGEVFLSSSDEKILCNTAASLVSLTRGDHARVAESKAQLRKVVVELRDRLVDLMASDDATLATSAMSIADTSATQSRSKRRSSRKKSSDSSVGSSQTSLTDDAESAAARDTEYSIYLNMQRLKFLAKRCDLTTFFETDDNEVNQLELLCNFVCDGLKRRLRACKPLDIRTTADDEETATHKLIDSPDVLAAIGKSVNEGLTFILTTIGTWLRLVLTCFTQASMILLPFSRSFLS
jgi:hypothetical protein